MSIASPSTLPPFFFPHRRSSPRSAPLPTLAFSSAARRSSSRLLTAAAGNNNSSYNLLHISTNIYYSILIVQFVLISSVRESSMWFAFGVKLLLVFVDLN
ncbi:hypothetical protein Droror1_Dr00027638 [Drosera rotundifolia]